MIGELDRRITISSCTVTQSLTGEATRTWSTWRTCWVMVEEAGGNESIAAETPTVTGDLNFTIRYVTGVNEKMRITYNGVNYGIKHKEEIDRKRYLKLTASIPDNE